MINSKETEKVQQVSRAIEKYECLYGMAGMTVRDALEMVIRSSERGMKFSMEKVAQVLEEISQCALHAKNMLEIM